jgi:serine/threonine protein kinase
VVAAIAEALHHAHLRMVVHRDVKPANILIDGSDKPYLADFGLALKEEDFAEGSGGASTPAYTSPEQAVGEGQLVDGRADIFSLGVVFYELLTAIRPFWDADREKVLERIRTLEPRPPRQIDDTIPKELERICLKALSKRPSDRYSTALDMAEDLSEFLKPMAPVHPKRAELSWTHYFAIMRDSMSSSPRSCSTRTKSLIFTECLSHGSNHPVVRSTITGRLRWSTTFTTPKTWKACVRLSIVTFW